MEKENTGFALGLLGGTHDKEDREEMMRDYERRKANADKIEAEIMTACAEIAGRLERDAANMSNKEIAEVTSCMLGLSTVVGALGMYAMKPYSYCGCA